MTIEEAHKPLVVSRKNKSGVGTYGLYVNVYESDDKGNLLFEHRFFLAMNTLSTNKRPAGNARANWTTVAHEDFDFAKAALLTALVDIPAGGKSILVNGAPLLVELDGQDIQAIEKAMPPPARFLASQMMERRVGKLDDKAFKMPAAPKAV